MSSSPSPQPTGLLELLLLQSGDVEQNPGPPRRNPASSGPPKKEPTKEEKEHDIGSKVGDRAPLVGRSNSLLVHDNIRTSLNRTSLHYKLEYDCCNFSQAILNFDANLQYIRDYEDKIHKMEKQLEAQRSEIDKLKSKMEGLEGVDDKLLHMSAKIDAITGVYDDLHEKMHEIDKTRKNNLLFYGIKPDFLPEIQTQLEQKILEIIKHNLNIHRDVPVTKISRMISGPEVRGCRPVLVNFVHWKDREEVLRKSTFLKGSNIYITEDLSRKMREHRQELHKYARQIRSRSPNKKCVLRQDKLFIDNQMYVFDEDRHEVVRFTRPPSPPRVPSRNYSSVDNGLRRSTSVHSVNGEASMYNGDQGSPRGLAPGSASSMGPSLPTSASGQKYPSAESLHHPYHASEANGSNHQNNEVSLALSVPKQSKLQKTAPIPETEEIVVNEIIEKKEVKVVTKAPPAPPKKEGKVKKAIDTVKKAVFDDVEEAIEKKEVYETTKEDEDEKSLPLKLDQKKPSKETKKESNKEKKKTPTNAPNKVKVAAEETKKDADPSLDMPDETQIKSEHEQVELEQQPHANGGVDIKES